MTPRASYAKAQYSCTSLKRGSTRNLGAAVPITYCTYGREKLTDVLTLDTLLKRVLRASLYLLKESKSLKRQYSSKAKSSNFKICMVIFVKLQSKLHTPPLQNLVLYPAFWNRFKKKCEISVLVGFPEHENNESLVKIAFLLLINTVLET
jgi:hypothetical protein